MREPIATAALLTAGSVVAPSTAAAATMFGISNAQIVQSFNGQHPLAADCPPSAASVGPLQPCLVRTMSRASSIGGPGGGTLLGSLKAAARGGSSGSCSPVTASVKRNSSSSSFSSGGDRRSIFYTDPEQGSTASELV
uniref:Uncharacterized protein n=1 Tax=Anopheles dirus TaxID=7168 RepID=A0A182NUM5_9DIPT